MPDFNKPQIGDPYGDVLQAVRDLLAECAKFQDGSSNTNVPTGAVRFSSTNKRFEKWNGSSWVELIAKASDKYDINVDRVDGYDAGNDSWNIPVSNGTVNTNLNADMLDGNHASSFVLAPPQGQGGVRRLYRNNEGDYFNVQTYWTGMRMRLCGYWNDTYYSEAEVSYADSAGGVPWSGVTGKPTNWSSLTGNDSFDVNLNTRVNSGFYQQSSPTVANGWPVNGTWHHALVCTHSNSSNYYSMQFASDFFDNKLYYRSTVNNGNASWVQLWHSGNFDPNTKANVSTSLQKSGDTANELYNNGWFRSNGNVGWYNQTHGGGIWMSDWSWVRVYGGKGFLTDWHEFHHGGNIRTSSYGWLHDRFANANPNAEAAADRVTGNCGNIALRSGVEIFNAGGGVLQTRNYVINCSNCNCNCDDRGPN